MFGLFKKTPASSSARSDTIPDVTKTVAETIPLLREDIVVDTREVEGDTVRVDIRTETETELVTAELLRDAVNVRRVAVDRPVTELPATRTEGATTIIPVMRERLVLKKELVLVEEIHITHDRQRTTVEREVELRRQEPVISRRSPVA